jgi:hypothetical protein
MGFCAKRIYPIWANGSGENMRGFIIFMNLMRTITTRGLPKRQGGETLAVAPNSVI